MKVNTAIFLIIGLLQIANLVLSNSSINLAVCVYTPPKADCEIIVTSTTGNEEMVSSMKNSSSCSVSQNVFESIQTKNYCNRFSLFVLQCSTAQTNVVIKSRATKSGYEVLGFYEGMTQEYRVVAECRKLCACYITNSYEQTNIVIQNKTGISFKTGNYVDLHQNSSSSFVHFSIRMKHYGLLFYSTSVSINGLFLYSDSPVALFCGGIQRNTIISLLQIPPLELFRITGTGMVHLLPRREGISYIYILNNGSKPSNFRVLKTQAKDFNVLGESTLTYPVKNMGTINLKFTSGLFAMLKTNISGIQYNVLSLKNILWTQIGVMISPPILSTEKSTTLTAGILISSSTSVQATTTIPTTTKFNVSFSTGTLSNSLILRKSTMHLQSTADNCIHGRYGCFGTCLKQLTFNHSVLADREKLRRVINLLKQQLKVNKTNLSSFKRKRTCADDDRPSARNLGYVGVTVLLTITFFLIGMDITRINRLFTVAKLR